MAIKAKIIENGTLRLILVGDTEVSRAALKALQGAKCTVITENLKVFDEGVHEGLLIEVERPQQQEQ